MGFRMSSTRMFGSKTTDKESEGGEENENGEIEIDETQLVQDMLYRIRQVNNLPKDIELIDFQVDGILLGKVKKDPKKKEEKEKNEEGQKMEKKVFYFVCSFH